MKQGRACEDPCPDGIEKSRLWLGYILLGVIILIDLVTTHSWPEDSWFDELCDATAYCLILTGVMGRLWCLLYIGGKKNKELIVYGPYSLCRNPLYFFSIVSYIGLVFLFENFLLILPLYLYCFFIFKNKIRKEEAKLLAIFPDSYPEYRRRTNRIIPAFSGFQSGQLIQVSPQKIAYGFAQMIPFLVLIPASEIIEHLHATGWLPTLWTIP